MSNNAFNMSRYECRGVGLKGGLADRLPPGREEKKMDLVSDKDKRDAGGWVIISRAVQDHWVWDEKPFSKGQAWIDLILLAKYRDGEFMDWRGNLVEGKRGYVYRSERYLADRWGWSRKKVSNFFTQLAKNNMIELNKNRASDRTTIFIVNYDNFQRVRTSQGANKEPVENQSGTTQEPVENQSGTYTKKDKRKIKNKKEIKDIVDTDMSTRLKREFDPDSFEMQCVECLIASCLETFPKARVPDTTEKKQKWAVEIEKMKRLDNLSEEEINQALQFATHDGFWKTNIRSTKKFREKFETLYTQSNRTRREDYDEIGGARVVTRDGRILQ